MKKTIVHIAQQKISLRHGARRWVWAAAVVLILCFSVLSGRHAVAADLDLPMLDLDTVDLYNNANVGTNFCTCTPPATWPTLCDYSTQTSQVKAVMLKALEETLMLATNQLEIFIGDQLVDGMMQAFLTKLNNNETSLIDWWDTFWFYNFYPALQEVAESVVGASQDQVRSTGASADAGLRQEQEQTKQVATVEDESTMRPSENVCVMATTAGGQGRANNITKAFQNAWEQDSKTPGTNKAGTPGATSRAGAEAKRHQKYEDIFCDPSDNNGNNTCGSQGPQPERFWNADVQPTKFLFEAKTIPVDQDARYGQAIQALLDNMVGTTSNDPIPPEVMQSAEGQEALLQRRSYLARHAMVRSVPQLVAGWRMPGSGLGPWVSELRKSAGTPDAEVSGNPSYREVIYATAVERFNTGKFANDMVTDPLVVEREKLALDTIYLMQLRDYYELLERQAATLAIQVALLAEQAGEPSLVAAVPLQ